MYLYLYLFCEAELAEAHLSQAHRKRTTQRKPCAVYVSRGGGVPELYGALAAAVPRRHRRATLVSLAAAAPDDRVAFKATGLCNKNGKVLRQFIQLVARGPRARRRARAQAAAGMDEMFFGTLRVVRLERRRDASPKLSSAASAATAAMPRYSAV